MSRLGKWLPLIGLLALAGAFFALGGTALVSPASLARRYGELRGWADADLARAFAVYVGVYAALVATVIFPGAFLLTIAGGMLFGTLGGALGAVLGVNLGGIVAFLAARRALARGLALGAKGEAMRAGLAREGVPFLLVLRTTPLLPYWVVTLAAAAANLSLKRFLIGSVLGVIPPCFVFARLGSGLAQRIAAGEHVSFAGLATAPEVVWPLAGLAAIGFGALLVRRALKRRASAIS